MFRLYVFCQAKLTCNAHDSDSWKYYRKKNYHFFFCFRFRFVLIIRQLTYRADRLSYASKYSVQHTFAVLIYLAMLYPTGCPKWQQWADSFDHFQTPWSTITTQISNAFSPEFYNMKQACHSSTWFWVDITLILLKSPKKLKLTYDISSDFWTMLMDDIFGLLRSQRCKMRLFKGFWNTVSSLNSRKTIHARNQT